MSQLDVRIVRLPPMRVASAYAHSASPESDALAKLVDWARPLGLLDDPDEYQTYGFNNPNPSAGSPNYGYEFWLVVGPEVQPAGEVKIKEFEGGLYAVTRCPALPQIGRYWQRLATWRETSPYGPACHQWLEHAVGPVDAPESELVLDLYLPIQQ